VPTKIKTLRKKKFKSTTRLQPHKRTEKQVLISSNQKVPTTITKNEDQGIRVS